MNMQKFLQFLICTVLAVGQIGKFAECAGDLSYIQISFAIAAVFVSLNNKFYCFLLLFYENFAAGTTAEI